MPSEKHDALLKAVCIFAEVCYGVQKKEWLVRIDAPEHDKPMSVEGFRPDFVARCDAQLKTGLNGVTLD